MMGKVASVGNEEWLMRTDMVGWSIILHRLMVHQFEEL